MILWWHLVTLFIASFWFDLASCFSKLTEGQLLGLLVIHTNFLEGFILLRDFSCDFSCIFCLLFLQLILFIFCCQICLWWTLSGEIYKTVHPCHVSSINSLLSSSHFPNISTHHRKFLLIFLIIPVFEKRKTKSLISALVIASVVVMTSGSRSGSSKD